MSLAGLCSHVLDPQDDRAVRLGFGEVTAARSTGSGAGTSAATAGLAFT